jgi:hypothetical protein
MQAQHEKTRVVQENADFMRSFMKSTPRLDQEAIVGLLA